MQSFISHAFPLMLAKCFISLDLFLIYWFCNKGFGKPARNA